MISHETSKQWTLYEFLNKAADLFNPDAAEGISAVFQYELSGEGGGEFYYEVKDKNIKVFTGRHNNPSVTIKTSLDIWIKLMRKEIRPIKTFVSGKLNIKGDIVLAQKTLKIFSSFN